MPKCFVFSLSQAFVSRLRLQRYALFLNLQTFRELFSSPFSLQKMLVVLNLLIWLALSLEKNMEKNLSNETCFFYLWAFD